MEKSPRSGEEDERVNEDEGGRKLFTEPFDRKMTDEEFALFIQQMSKVNYQNEQQIARAKIEELEAKPDGRFASSFIKLDEQRYRHGEIDAKIKEYLLSLPEEARLEAFDRAKREGYPLHLLVPDEVLKDDTIVEGPRTLQ